MRRYAYLALAITGVVWRRRRARNESDAARDGRSRDDAPHQDLESAEWKIRAEVFARSYDEVLSALKHQDDKLNRTLTALAFLTAGGIALFVRAPVVKFPESGTSVPPVLFVVFLVAAVFALSLAVAAIGPSAPYHRVGARRRGAPRTESLLFYPLITKDPKWAERLGYRGSDLRQLLAENFNREAQVIGRRVEYKVARSRESGAFLQLAILSLSLLGIFSIGSFSLRVSWWVATGVLLTLLMAPFYDLLHMRTFGFNESPIAVGSYALLAISAGAAALLLATAPHAGEHWPALYFALVAFICSRLGVVRVWSARLFLGGGAVGGLVLLFVLALKK